MRSVQGSPWLILVGLLVVCVAGCGGGKNSTKPGSDTEAPARVTDLYGEAEGMTSIRLTWTAVGDDSMAGQAASYDIRYATNLGVTWDRMTQVSNEPEPRSAAEAESLSVTGLPASTLCQFLLKVLDNAGNTSALSNLAAVTTLGSEEDQHWWGGFAAAPHGQGIDGSVYALAPFGSDLIAAGRFTRAGGISANNIARWDGSSWSPLGSGMNGSVVALAEYDGALVAGGPFTKADGGPAMYLAFWYGGHWVPPPEALDGPVAALGIYEGDLMVGGGFTRAGDQVVNHIARWDGTWSSLGPGVDDWVKAMTVHEDRLIAGGYFTQAGGDTAVNIAAWDGASWSPVGRGTPGPNSSSSGVLALAVHEGALFAGGSFQEIGGTPAYFVARWDGLQWEEISGLGASGTDNPGIFALTVFDGALIAAGRFQHAGTENAYHIARLRGYYWSSLGSGIGARDDPAGLALAVLQGRLFVGGNIQSAGNRPSYGIARWDP